MSEKTYHETSDQSADPLEADLVNRLGLLEISDIGLFKECITDGRFQWVNENFSAMLGYSSPAQLIAQNLGLSRFANPKHFDTFWQELNDRGRITSFEMDIEPFNGDTRRLQVCAAMLPEGDRLAGMAIDISRHHQVARSLKESEARLRLFIEHTPAPIAMFDAQMRYIAFSRRWVVDYRLGHETLIGKCHYDVFGSIPQKWKEEHQRCLSGEVIDNEEEPFQRTDGTMDWVRRKIYPWRDTNGNIGGLILFTEVITDQVQIKEKLRESEAKYRKLVENATDAIFIAQDESIKFPNRKALQILGYEGEAPEKISFAEYIHPEDRNMVLDIHRKRLSGVRDLPTTYSFRITNRKGVLYVLQLSAVVIEWEGRLATLNFVRDITEQKRLEKSLQQAHKMDAIGTLAGGIAHDFNNILMGIQGHASLMLLDVFPSSPFYAHLKGIENYVRSAAELTSQLLGFARGGKYQVIPLDLNQLVDESAQLFGRTKKEISIHKNLDAGLWAVEVDQNQIEQVLFNIYVNAWQAMPSGGSLYLQTGNAVLDDCYVKPFQVTPGRYAKITITDTGVGMDKTTQEKIFEPFFTTRAMGHGTGLGMASAYGIIKNHNGIINVYSEKGKGTTFSIYLPASARLVSSGKEKEPGPLTGEETILLVDDESLILDVGMQMLKKLGYTVHVAESGMRALELYERYGQQIGLVILDMIMPGMNGGDTYDHLKRLNPNIKVLLSSGYSINGDASTILDRGCSGFIQKPFNLMELSQKIREILDTQT